MNKLLKNFVLVVVLGLLLLSAGCGGKGDYYNLSSWSPPVDAAFTSFVRSMDSPSKLKSWIGSNCTYLISYKTIKSPYEFWKTKIGDCSEAGALNSYCLHQHGYTTYQVYILYTENKAHRICIYKVGSSYGYTSYHWPGTTGYYQYFPSYKACVEDWDKRTTRTVEAYTVFNWAGTKIEIVGGTKIIERGIYDGE